MCSIDLAGGTAKRQCSTLSPEEVPVEPWSLELTYYRGRLSGIHSAVTAILVPSVFTRGYDFIDGRQAYVG